ncbi:hypothetical protein Bca4012_025872 [Brassica carinata]
MSVANPLSSPRTCGMASSVIGGILTPLESPGLALSPVDEQGHRPMLHSTGQKPHAGVRMDMAKETGELPSLLQLYERTPKNKAGQFLDARSEQIFNDLVGRVEDRQTQLTQQSTDGLPITLSTLEVTRR